MSLLLDARKKVELALKQSDVHKATEPRLPETLRLEDSPAAKQHAAPARDTPDNVPLAGARGGLRAAGQNLFAAKTAPVPTGGRLGIIPIALISGLVLAAGGGYYVWREISPPPMQRQKPASPPATPLASTAPPAAPVTRAVPSPATSAAPTIFAAPAIQTTRAKANATKENGRTPGIPASSTPPAPHNTAAQPIRIEHTQQGNAVDPTLLAAWEAYRNDDLRTAWQHYGDMLRKDAKNRDALLGMAAIAQQQSQDAVAARYYNQVLMLDPRDPVANAGMSALAGTSDAAATESRLKLLLAQYPQSAALYFALGNQYAEQSRWSDAQQAYFNACNLEQNNAQFAFNLAVSLDHLGQGKLAAQHYQRALQLDTSDNAGFSRAQTQQRINELAAP